jgi:hypothetical protein
MIYWELEDMKIYLHNIYFKHANFPRQLLIGPSCNYGLCPNLAMGCSRSSPSREVKAWVLVGSENQTLAVGCSRSSPSRGSRHGFWLVLKIRPSPVLAIMEQNQWWTAGWCQVLLFFSKTSVLVLVPEQNRTPNLVSSPVLQENKIRFQFLLGFQKTVQTPVGFWLRTKTDDPYLPIG